MYRSFTSARSQSPPLLAIALKCTLAVAGGLLLPSIATAQSGQPLNLPGSYASTGSYGEGESASGHGAQAPQRPWDSNSIYQRNPDRGGPTGQFAPRSGSMSAAQSLQAQPVPGAGNVGARTYLQPAQFGQSGGAFAGPPLPGTAPGRSAGPVHSTAAVAHPTAATNAAVPAAQQQVRQGGEHPIRPALRWAYQGLEQMQQLQDYSCLFVKRERSNGVLGEYEYIQMKVRHKPFSVYLGFLAPERVKGQEAIYVHGKNDGKMMAHTTGVKHRLVGTVALDPTGYIAMQNSRYPITDVGIVNLTRKLIEVGESDAQYGECEVKVFRNAKVNDRVCTCLQFMHPVPRREFRYHLARIYVDDEYNLPIRYEAYDWPKTPGGSPELTEEYTYMNLKLNNGFTDFDFDIRNPQYRFGN